MKTFRRK